MVAELWLQVEVVGCPTVCRHCWAQGVPYPAMPVDEVAWVLEQAHRFCDDHGLGFGAYPMHELAAHPQAVELLRLFADHVGAVEFEPLSTTGVPLATREDWQELLTAAATLGTTTIWVAFHGVGTEHDRQVNRTDAFTETCLAVQRVHSVGLRAGCNVFLTTANLPQAERLLGVLQRLQVDQMWWGPATYYPTARGRRNERLRPALSELLPLADRIRTLRPLDHDVWANLEAHTEAAWARRALAGDGPSWTRHAGEVLELVCRPTSTCTPAPPAGTASGAATCAPTARRRRSPTQLRKVGGPQTRCGLVPTRCRRLPSWPPGMATPTGRGSTSAQTRCGPCGWTGRSQHDAPRPSAVRSGRLPRPGDDRACAPPRPGSDRPGSAAITSPAARSSSAARPSA
jgi:hypothetical protein